MLFLVFVLVSVIFTVLFFVSKKLSMWGDGNVAALCISVTGWVISAIMSIIILFAHIGIDSFVGSRQQEYVSLKYQLENNMYNNDNELGKKELYNQIQEWNQNLAYDKLAQNDVWIGIFYANVYDQFEFIDLEQQ